VLLIFLPELSSLPTVGVQVCLQSLVAQHQDSGWFSAEIR
jgi:hypothetical protein